MRPVTQGDVYRAETEEIPRIFQVGHFFLSLRFLLFFVCSLNFWCQNVKSDSVKLCYFSEILILLQSYFDVTPALYSDSVCQRGRVQEGGGHGDGPTGRQDQLSPTQRPRVHPHTISLPFQLRGLCQASVARLQAASSPRVSPLPCQVPQGPPRQKGGRYCSLQR